MECGEFFYFLANYAIIALQHGKLTAKHIFAAEMTFSVFDHARVRQVLTISLLSGTLLCIFPPRQPAFQWWADQAFFIALGYLLFGLFFLIIDNPRLMFVCLGCSAAICFFKNEALDDRMPMPGAPPPIEQGFLQTPKEICSFPG